MYLQHRSFISHIINSPPKTDTWILNSLDTKNEVEVRLRESSFFENLGQKISLLLVPITCQWFFSCAPSFSISLLVPSNLLDNHFRVRVRMCAYVWQFSAWIYYLNPSVQNLTAHLGFTQLPHLSRPSMPQTSPVVNVFNIITIHSWTGSPSSG